MYPNLYKLMFTIHAHFEASPDVSMCRAIVSVICVAVQQRLLNNEGVVGIIANVRRLRELLQCECCGVHDFDALLAAELQTLQGGAPN